jgi:hypothetical protein
LLDQLEHTLRAKFTLGPAGMAFLEQLGLRVRVVEPTPLGSPVSRDADDDALLATAVAAGAAVGRRRLRSDAPPFGFAQSALSERRTRHRESKGATRRNEMSRHEAGWS